MDKVLAFWNDEEGATAIEYGLIAGLIAVALVVTLGSLGTRLDTVFTTILNALPGGGGGGGGS